MRNRRASVVFVLITLFIDILGMGLVIPILPRLVQSLLGGAIGEASFAYGLLVSIYAVMQFFCAPILGALSDRFGRRPIILLALAGLGFDYVLLSLAPNIWWLVLGRVVAGIFGATMTPAGAYIADVSPPEKRAANFGLIGMLFGLGHTAGAAGTPERVGAVHHVPLRLGRRSGWCLVGDRRSLLRLLAGRPGATGGRSAR